jgi:diguanylate cyclase (GGDEF)-like protein
MKAILSPAAAVMDRLRYPYKFSLINLLFALPLVLLMYVFISEIHDRIEFSTKEIKGDQYLRPLRLLVEDLTESRRLARGYAGGNAPLRADLVAKQAEIDRDFGKEQVVVHSAFDGASGLAMAREIAPDLILLDVDMPGRDGFAVCTDLKADTITMDTPIIFLTGASSTEDKIRGLELGAVDYVTKPFEPAELRARVRASLRTNYLVDLLSKKAMIDGLTGLWNRNYLDVHLVIQLAAARRSGNPLSCIMADADCFKSINDTYGHAFGDDAIRMIATVFTQCCRTEDIVCRYGGEEFTILLPNTTIEGAAELAERLRVGVGKHKLMYRDAPVGVTCSFGVANLRGQFPPSLLDLADSALYRAKHSGRNRVEIADELPCSTA